jgi:hypothetical protein
MMEVFMQSSDWLHVLASIGSWIIPVTAIVMWGVSSIFESRGSAPNRQNELLERIAVQLEKSNSVEAKQ